MKMFTLYQSALFTRISRYKLEQAIEAGHIKTIPGKGNIKCYISESELKNFLVKHADLYTNHVVEENPSFNSPENNNFISKETHEKMLKDKDHIIQLLEQKNDKFFPLLKDTDKVRLHLEQKFEVKVKQMHQFLREFADLIPEDKKEEKERVESRLTAITSL